MAIQVKNQPRAIETGDLKLRENEKIRHEKSLDLCTVKATTKWAKEVKTKNNCPRLKKLLMIVNELLHVVPVQREGGATIMSLN